MVVPAKFIDDLWDPSGTAKVWEKLASTSPTVIQTLTDSPENAPAILNFLTFSPVSLEKVCRRPELLQWLSHSDVQNP
ncbi:MAG TPA: hypothetical protein VJX28_08995, partial [Chthoniobacterales bacterium]|nr:hypothetical protein [Chthoniobacterales bacterium]